MSLFRSCSAGRTPGRFVDGTANSPPGTAAGELARQLGFPSIDISTQGVSSSALSDAVELECLWDQRGRAIRSTSTYVVFQH